MARVRGAAFRDSDTEAPVRTSGLTATSSSEPVRLPWQPPQTLLNRARGGPGVMYSPGVTWCSSVILRTELPLPSTNSRISGLPAGISTFKEWSDSNEAWPIIFCVPLKVFTVIGLLGGGVSS